MSSGGGSGGSLKTTAETQEPRVMGSDRNGPEVIAITAAVVITPPYLRSLSGVRVNSMSRRLTLIE